MPVFSLPNGCQIGDVGPGAYRFVDFLQSAGQTIWQLLPLGPSTTGDSPYSSYSAFAGNPLLISCDELVSIGLLTEQQLQQAGHVAADTVRVDYTKTRATKEPLLKLAFDAFQQLGDGPLKTEFAQFCESNDAWLTDFARFDAIATDCGNANWTMWDAGLVRREVGALAAVDERLADEIQFACFSQFIFAKQWNKLKDYANERRVRIYGDMPIFVAHESVDVWTNQELFLLDENGRPTVVAGVPPDYFSTTGQMWGNPLYNWQRMAETNYEWWINRFRQAFQCFDILRIDHFRGFESFWEIPADAENAIGGQWKPGPRDAPFVAAQNALGELAIVAEDLGMITDEVHGLREQLGFPGMRVMQFGCDHDHDAYHRPDCYPQHSFAYSGTHDNDTVVGWYTCRQNDGANQDIVNRFLSGNPEQLHQDLVRAVLNSAADTAIIPMQDLLGLGSEARTNTPGEPTGNWAWRCPTDSLTDALANDLKSWTVASARL
ncbi:UNVERIFIED_CONTAM: hypothetical protein GTU68_049179 [Idotea baltica]|nr:hypothetical protein [Idotea baltica]